MKDYYTLKEVLLGLRNEQLRIAAKLNELNEKMTVYGDSRYEKSNFTFSENNNLLYFLSEKNTLLENILCILSFKFKDIIEGDCYLESIRQHGNGNYRIGGIGGIKSNVKEAEQEEFNKLIEDILKDEFVKNVNINLADSKGFNYSNQLLTNSCSTKYTNSTFGKIDAVSYHAKDDHIRIKNIYDNWHRRDYSDILRELLEIKFSRKDFPEYIQSIIDNNLETKKDIILPTTKIFSKQADFCFENKQDAFVLVKIK